MKTKSQFVLLSLLLCSAFNPSGALFAQGNLNPPGPPAPMFRTLEEVQPRRPIGTNTTPGDAFALFKITQPGSYFLTTNIAGVAGKDGIMIAASGVTLDLMGFEMVGVSNSLTGINNDSNTRSNVFVRNGTVRNWQAGVALLGVRGTQCQDLRVSANSGLGIQGGFNGTVANCVARANGTTGISTGVGSVVSGCTAVLNGNTGIYTENGIITGCTASSTGLEGISARFNSIVTGCTAQGNLVGIRVQGNCTVNSCAAGGNSISGIEAESSSIIGCTANANDSYGINVNGKCRVTDNTCVGNGAGSDGAGIVVSSDGGSRIENNHVVDTTGKGIWILIAGNLIMRNSASGNTTNYVIVAGNKVGPIVAAPSSGAISGNTGGTGVGTTDPWANFSF